MRRLWGSVFAVAIACGGPQRPTTPKGGNQRDETSKPVRSTINGVVEARGNELAIRLIERDTCVIKRLEDVTVRGKTETREVGTPREVPCGERMVTGRGLVLVAGDREAELAKTDAQGLSVTHWDVLSPMFLEGDKAPERADAHVDSKQGATVVIVDLSAPRTAAAERAWAAADQAGTARAAISFRARFPGQRTADVAKRISEKADGEMNRAVGAALDAGNLVAARTLINEWAALVPASEARKQRESVLAAREQATRIETLVADTEQALAATGEPTDLAALNRAGANVTEMVKLAPADSRVTAMAKRVSEAKKARQKILFARAADEAKQDRADAALKLGDIAHDLQPETGAAPRLELRKSIARKLAADATKKAAAKDFTAAAELQSKADAVLADDRVVAASRKEIERKQAAEEAAIKDAAERERKKAERLAQAEALKAQREAEKAAREAERQAREEEKKRKAEEAKQKAEAERQAKLDEEKRKQEEARAKAELARATKEEQERIRKAGEIAAKAEAARKKEEAKAEAARKAEEAKAERKKEKDDKTRKQQPGAVAVAPAPRVTGVADAITQTALAGVWAATGRAARDRVTLMFHAMPSGSGTVTVLASSGRVLARQAVSWSVSGGDLEISGGERLALTGRVELAKDQLSWAGYRWQRVRGRTTLVTATPEKQP